MTISGWLLGGLLGRTGKTITAVDDRDLAGGAGRLTHYVGSVPMTSVSTMVDNVIAALDGDLLSRLNIIDHGNAEILSIGDDLMSFEGLPARGRIPAAPSYKVYERQLGRLFGRFADDGFVHLQHCTIGQDRRLLRALAAVFGVPVVAGTELTYSVAWLNQGDMVVAYPDGTTGQSFDRFVGFFRGDGATNGNTKEKKL
jgi:hypothetical protein